MSRFIDLVQSSPEPIARQPINIRPQQAFRRFDEGPEPEWRNAVRIIRSNWRIASIFAASVVVSVTIFSLLMTPVYEPVARIRIDPPRAEGPSDHEAPMSEAAEQNYVDTETEILKTDGLAIEAIQTLHLDNNPEFVRGSRLGRLIGWLSRFGREQSFTNPEAAALRSFHERLSVKRVRDSHLVEISFASRDPKLAADVTNLAANLFIDRDYRNRYRAMMAASAWHSHELEDLRQKIESANQALAEYQNASGIVDVDEKQNTVTQKVAELNRQLAQAQVDRIQLEAYVRMIGTANENSLPPVRDNMLVQTLSQRIAESRAQLAQIQSVYGEDNFNTKKLQSEVDELEAQLAKERKRIVQQLETSYESSRAREQLLARALNDMKGMISAMNTKVIQYNFRKKEAQAREDLYDSLLARLKETVISAGVKTGNIVVIDPARVLDTPSRPHRLQMIAAGFMLAILGGVALAVVKESMNKTIHCTEDIKKWTGLPTATSVPLINTDKSDGNWVRILFGPIRLLADHGRNGDDQMMLEFFAKRPVSPEAESVRRLHNWIKLVHPKNPLRVLLVASASAGEGKTTVAINLAMAIAQQRRTCLVAADMRKITSPSLREHTTSHGLSTILGQAEFLEESLAGSLLHIGAAAQNLWYLPSGPVPSNPGELVASHAMRAVLQALRRRFDHIIIDSAPLITYSDALVLMPFVDGVILVGRYNVTTQEELAVAAEMLEQARAPVLGVVLNGVDSTSSYYRYYGYR